MKYIATVLICLTNPCTPDNALMNGITVPEPVVGLATCMMHGQAYVAKSGLVGPDDVVKVRCTPVKSND